MPSHKAKARTRHRPISSKPNVWDSASGVAGDLLPLALGHWGDPEVTQLIDARGQLTDDQVRDRLIQELATVTSHSMQYRPIFRLDRHEHVGCCGLRPYESPVHRGKILEIGFHINSAHWGHGYASEAAHAVIAYAFSDLGASGLFAGHNPNSHTLRHLLMKLGFQYTHDEFYPPTELNHPCNKPSPPNTTEATCKP